MNLQLGTHRYRGYDGCRDYVLGVAPFLDRTSGEDNEVDYGPV